MATYSDDKWVLKQVHMDVDKTYKGMEKVQKKYKLSISAYLRMASHMLNTVMEHLDTKEGAEMMKALIMRDEKIKKDD